MKWALSQLIRYGSQPFYFDTVYDFKKRIENIDDILEIDLVKVKGFGKNVGENRFLFELTIQTEMILEDAVTLDPIPFPIDLVVEEYFDTTDDGQANLIVGNTIELDDLVWEIVYLEKPIRVTKQI
ncbi:MAG: hypothetical protein RBS25_06260 [Bacilli bacterium]|jgi:uncharacterized metal-binding protein YceD (DUF177 family)|nr:hypothetical protein [Bacilli bacterium]